MGVRRPSAPPTCPAAISLAEARVLMLAECAALPPRRVDVSAATGLVLAETVYAPEPLPRFTNSAMDGYALRAADTAGGRVMLRVPGDISAGDEPQTALLSGEAIRIMTGAPMPPGADSVCPLEQVEIHDGGAAVLIPANLSAYQNVRRAGEDLAAGAELFPARTRLGPAHIGVLAGLGIQAALVYPSPTVGVLSTGDELALPGEVLRTGKIRDANRPALLAQLDGDKFTAVDLGIATDDEAMLSSILEAAASRCDAIIATGGVSVGDRDMLKSVLEKLGGDSAQVLHVAVRPGQHVAFALIGERRIPVFGLAGNPVAALVAYELFARPALRSMAGCQVLDRPRLAAIAETDLPRRAEPDLRVVMVTATAGPSGQLHVRLSGGQRSHTLRTMAYANALALLPAGDGVRAGQLVEVLLLDGDDLEAADATTRPRPRSDSPPAS